MKLTDIMEKMPEAGVVENLADLLKVFADPTRCRILFVLEQSPLCVGDIAACIGMTKYAVSHQLRILKQASLVKSSRAGKEVIYALDDEHVSMIFECALAHVLEGKE